ncbi:MAG TPA: EB domain-containing protein, partial [Thermoanaerobaculia bacterium]
MIQHRLPVLAALAAATLLSLAAPAVAAPFRGPLGSLGTRAPSVDPFRRVAQAQNATPAPATPAAPAAAPQACTSDAQCPVNTICESGQCRPVERAINVLLFRKEGPSTWLIPFYWGRRGVPGYRVVFPFYWHFWSTEEKSQIVAPFYWRFEDYLKQRVVTVVIPYVHTRQPDAESWAVWPLFYASTRFGWAAPLLGSFKIEDPAEGRSSGLCAFLYYWRRSRTSSFDLAFPLFVSSRSTDSAFTYAIPLNFYWRSGSDSHLLALPLFYRSRDRDGSLLVSPIGYVSTAQGGAHRGAAAWLYWWGRR